MLIFPCGANGLLDPLKTIPILELDRSYRVFVFYDLTTAALAVAGMFSAPDRLASAAGPCLICTKPFDLVRIVSCRQIRRCRLSRAPFSDNCKHSLSCNPHMPLDSYVDSLCPMVVLFCSCRNLPQIATSCLVASDRLTCTCNAEYRDLTAPHFLSSCMSPGAI